MNKNATIIALVIIVLGLGGYVVWNGAKTQTSYQKTMDQNVVSTPNPNTPQVSGVAAKKSFVFLKNMGVNKSTVGSFDLATLATNVIAESPVINPIIAGNGQFIFQQAGRWNDASQPNSLMSYSSVDKQLHTVKVLAFHDMFSRSAVLSPDGKKIIYLTDSAYDCSTRQELRIMDLSTGDNSKITAFSNTLFGDNLNYCEDARLIGLSPDGAKLYMTAGATVQAGTQDKGLYVYDLVRNNFLEKLNTGDIMVNPVLSNDGKKIAYIPYASTSPVSEWTPAEPFAIKVLDISTGVSSIVSSNTKNAYSQIWWSDDGSKILYGINSLKPTPEFTTAFSYAILDLSLGQSKNVSLDYSNTIVNTVLSYDGTLLVYGEMAENSPSTSEDNDYTLKLYNFSAGTTQILGQYKNGGGYGFGALI